MTSHPAGRRRVILTGGAGNVARSIRPLLQAAVGELVIVDLADPGALAENETWIRADITDLAALTAAFQGADGLIHLAGYPNEREIPEMVRVNVLGTSLVYEAARIAGIGRVVLGSSNHAVGFYTRDWKIRPEDPMRPDSQYGLTKCWGELVAGLYFEKAGMRTLVIRIGNAQAQPTNPRSLIIWISPGDLVQLVLIGLDHPEVDVTTVYGASIGEEVWWDNSEATRLGYVPRDRIADFAPPDAFLPRQSPMPQVEDRFHGGLFCAFAHDGAVRDRKGSLPER